MMNIEGLERLTALGQRQRVSALFLNYKKFCSNFFNAVRTGRRKAASRQGTLLILIIKSLAPGRGAEGKK
ncbi:MAG: hypothetical protein KAW12_26875, partial [Candidatus Aminicenantes bacterium]|nr:hypothetical protein [Candidatus Aminicenantes bacterium]